MSRTNARLGHHDTRVTAPSLADDTSATYFPITPAVYRGAGVQSRSRAAISPSAYGGVLRTRFVAALMRWCSHSSLISRGMNADAMSRQTATCIT